MCCLLAVLAFLGPRFAIITWWLFRPGYFASTFDTIIWPLLGIIFLPFTTLMYLVVAPSGFNTWTWIWLIAAFIIDIASYSGSAYGNKNKIPGYSK